MGSTLVVYPLYNEIRYYRVSQDANFNHQEPIKTAFLRTYKQQPTSGNATIVMGHYTNVTQPGDHYVWLRHPLQRDLSHFNYDCKFDNQLSHNFAQHLSMMNGNFMVTWLYGKYLGRHDSASMEQRYKIVRDTLKNKFKKVYDTKKFESSWKEISKILKISENPKLKSNQADKDYNSVQKYDDLSNEFKKWHKHHNQYDYRLYSEFCE